MLLHYKEINKINLQLSNCYKQRNKAQYALREAELNIAKHEKEWNELMNNLLNEKELTHNPYTHTLPETKL